MTELAIDDSKSIESFAPTPIGILKKNKTPVPISTPP